MRYVFCIVAVILQPVLSYILLQRKNKESAALNMPLVYFGGVYLVVQFYVFFKYCIRFPERYEIYSYLIQGAIFGGFLILEMLLLSGNQYIKKVDRQEKESTKEFGELLQRLDIQRQLIEDGDKKRLLDKLYEKMRYQNPVSHNVSEENGQISVLIERLSMISNLEEFEKQCTAIDRLLEIRKIKNTGR